MTVCLNGFCSYAFGSPISPISSLTKNWSSQFQSHRSSDRCVVIHISHSSRYSGSGANIILRARARRTLGRWTITFARIFSNFPIASQSQPAHKMCVNIYIAEAHNLIYANAASGANTMTAARLTTWTGLLRGYTRSQKNGEREMYQEESVESVISRNRHQTMKC